MSIDPANNPFCRRADPATYGNRFEWLCTVAADERVRRVRDMDERDLELVIALPDVQRTVLKAAEARLKKLRRARA